jgi:DNA primase
LTRRGLSLDIIKEFEFGFAPNEKNLIYRMASNANEMFGANRSKEIV